MVASNIQDNSNPKRAESATTNRGMVLPFRPLSLAFDHVNYYVDMPTVNFYTLFLFNHLPKFLFTLDIIEIYLTTLAFLLILYDLYTLQKNV